MTAPQGITAGPDGQDHIPGYRGHYTANSDWMRIWVIPLWEVVKYVLNARGFLVLFLLRNEY